MGFSFVRSKKLFSNSFVALPSVALTPAGTAPLSLNRALKRDDRRNPHIGEQAREARHVSAQPRTVAWLELRQEVILIVDDRATTLIGEDALCACHGATIVHMLLFDQRRANEQPRLSSHAAASSGNSTIASPVATFSPAWFFTMTSIRTQREFLVTCFDLTIPVG
jgi:hypothetical protein